MKKDDSRATNRRDFLKRAAVTGGAAAATVAAGAAVADADTAQEAAKSETVEASRGYRVTSHVSEYYRLARF